MVEHLLSAVSHLNGLGVDGRLVRDEVHAALALLLLQGTSQVVEREQ